MLKVTGLRCEYLSNPLGVAAKEPRLSWKLVSNGRGCRQASWQVRAARTAEQLHAGEADIWDSGEVASSAQLVPVPALQVAGGTRVWWTVLVKDGEGNLAEAKPAWFETEFPEKEWGADWIGYPANWAGSTLRFRHSFVIKGKVRRARLYSAGLGWVELWLNGRRVNDRVLDPPQSDTSKRVYAAVDTLEGHLVQGENVLGIRAGYGWYGTVRLKLHLRVEYVDGSLATFGTSGDFDGGWQVTRDAAVEQSVYGGETYDARLDHPDWCKPGRPGGDWYLAQYMDGPGGQVQPAALEPIRVLRTLPAVSISQPRPGVFVADFGTNLAGWARIRVQGEAGNTVTLRFAETLYEDGTVNQENLRGAAATDRYILRGEGVEEWEPSFTYHGFRYLQAEGWPGEMTLKDVEARQVWSDVGEAGQFESSSELLNRIHEMVRQTERSNLHSVPTDCPQRDERMGWLNDMAARSEELMYNFAPGRLLAKWLLDISDAQDSLGRITDTAPFHWGKHPADPVSVCYLLDAWLLHTHLNDQVTMAERFPGMKAWVDFLAGQRKDGLVRYSYWDDWSPPAGRPVSPPEGDSPVNRETPGELVSTAFLAYSARLLSQMAEVLGKKTIARRYLKLFEQTALDFNEAFWDEEAGGYGRNNQSANALALYMGLVPEERIQACGASLLRAVEKADGHLATGNICTKYLLEALGQIGRTDVALRIALQETYPSWGYMLANGATTLWERWEKAVGGAMNSHNHPMMGSVGSWLYRWLAGIRAHSHGAGFRRFSILPETPAGLDWVRASLETMQGPIRSEWRREGEKLVFLVEIPAGSEATVGLPVEGWGEVREGKVCVWKDEQRQQDVPGLRGAFRAGARVRFQLGSGVYRFSVPA